MVLYTAQKTFIPRASTVEWAMPAARLLARLHKFIAGFMPWRLRRRVRDLSDLSNRQAQEIRDLYRRDDAITEWARKSPNMDKAARLFGKLGADVSARRVDFDLVSVTVRSRAMAFAIPERDLEFWKLTCESPAVRKLIVDHLLDVQSQFIDEAARDIAQQLSALKRAR